MPRTPNACRISLPSHILRLRHARYVLSSPRSSNGTGAWFIAGLARDFRAPPQARAGLPIAPNRLPSRFGEYR